MAVALSTLVDIPFVMKRALADGSIGLNGKKILFIWLRGANDGLNSVIPIQDPTYATIRPDIGIPKDLANNVDYSAPGNCFDATQFSLNANQIQVDRTANDLTYSYNKAIHLGNGFAALHPSLKFLAPVYNAGDLALIHRVAYPKQSRSHFDSQNYWENGSPNNNLSKDGIFYRTIIESGLANVSALTGVSIQSSLPLILRGSAAAMTNLTSPTRYDLLGVPTPAGDVKAYNAINNANYYPFANKRSRDLLQLQYANMSSTLKIFADMDFAENPSGGAKYGNYYRDNVFTDNDDVWANATPNANPNDANRGYYLFPTTNAKNGGYQRPGGANANKYVVSTGHQGFFTNLKAAALILNNTDAIIAGTEIGGFDTHQTQGGVTGAHANLQRVIGWSMYALRKYFTLYSNKVNWNDVVVVTLSEFGRTSVENSDNGTDHAEGGVTFVAGGAVKGYGKGNPSGVFGCSDLDTYPWRPGPRTTNFTTCGTMFLAGVPEGSTTINPTVAGYLRRSCDYRSILGEIIREHLGATQDQLNRIIPGYANPAERLLQGGLGIDNVNIRGEVGIL
jgi:uncharacterized protein (DUF1501 family)